MPAATPMFRPVFTAAVERGAVAADVRGVHAHSHAQIVAMPSHIFITVTAHGLNSGIIPVTVTGLCHSRHGKYHAQQAEK